MPRPERRASFLVPLLLAVLLISEIPPSGAQERDSDQDADSKLRRIEQQLEAGRGRAEELKSKAATLGRQVEALRQALIESAANAQNKEESVTRLEEDLRALSQRRTAKESALAARRAELGAILGALQRLARRPRETVIARPASAVDTVRSSLLLGAVVPDLDARARRLREELADLEKLEESIVRRRAALAKADDVLVKERQELERLLARKAALRERTEADKQRETQRLARLAGEAEDLRGLLMALEAERRIREEEARAGDRARPKEPTATDTAGAAPPPPRKGAESQTGTRLALAAPAARPVPTRPFSQARGTLPLPARGRIVTRFGERTEFGTPALGPSVETRSLAQVIAPYDGRIAFAGPYRGYGQLLIIEHGEGYHTLLAGLSRIDGAVGQWLLAGEPVGRMGAGSEGKQVLYVELRRDGEPVNPVPWLAASERRTSG